MIQLTERERVTITTAVEVGINEALKLVPICAIAAFAAGMLLGFGLGWVICR